MLGHGALGLNDWVAGTDLDVSEYDVPEVDPFRAAGDAAQDLDLWASCHGRAA